MLPLESDLACIAALADRQRDDSQAFVYYVDTMWDREGRSEAELDALVEAIAASVIPQFDCMVCANCCRSMHVGLTPADIPALAGTRNLPPRRFTARYVDVQAAASFEEWGVFRARPCLFGATIGALYIRHSPRGTANTLGWCPIFAGRGRPVRPIIFHVFECLKRALGWH